MKLNKFLNLNYLFIFIVILLSIFGFAALYSAADGNLNPWSLKHAIRFIIFFLMMIFIAIIDIKFIYKYTYYFFILCLCLLFSVEIIGTLGKGAERWIKKINDPKTYEMAISLREAIMNCRQEGWLCE